MTDEEWMRLALTEAQKALGLCVPNPMVGAAIVRNGELLGLGYHHKAGEAHAEINALHAVPSGCDLRDATLYVTLEPCSTWGRTPPCCDAIIASGIRRVVIGALDDNPAHRGAAITRLQAAGINVEHGVLEDECRRINEHFFWWITQRRPWVILKMGMSLDGKIALPDGTSKWITGAQSRSDVQRLRRLSQMIMVGGRTACLDNPSLMVHEPADWPNQPRPAVWSSHALPTNLQIASRALVAKPQTQAAWREFLSARYDEGVQVLLLEGGGELAANALACGIVNKVYFYIAPIIIGGRNSASVVAGDAPATLADAIHLRDVSIRHLGSDICYSGYISGCFLETTKSGAEKMNSSKNGMNVSAKVVELAKDFMLVDYCGNVYRIDFERFPYFRYCLLDELYNVQASADGLHWPDADIDIEIAHLENPPAKVSEVDLEWWKSQRDRLISRIDAIGSDPLKPSSRRRVRACTLSN